MKKLLFFIIAVATVSLVACGGEGLDEVISEAVLNGGGSGSGSGGGSGSGSGSGSSSTSCYCQVSYDSGTTWEDLAIGNTQSPGSYGVDTCSELTEVLGRNLPATIVYSCN